MTKQKILVLLSFGLLLTIACAVAGPTQAPTVEPMLPVPGGHPNNTPTPYDPVNNPSESSAYHQMLTTGNGYDLDGLTHLAFDTFDEDFALSLDGWSLKFINGAEISGYGNTTPYTKAECQSLPMSADELSWQTDLYLCFKTNLGRYGYIVIREAASDAIWFDVILFP